MLMRSIDPKVAARVWERVQAGHEKQVPPPCCEIPVVTVPPEAWKEKPDRPRRRQIGNSRSGQGQSPWVILLLLWLLCCGKTG